MHIASRDLVRNINKPLVFILHWPLNLVNNKCISDTFNHSLYLGGIGYLLPEHLGACPHS